MFTKLLLNPSPEQVGLYEQLQLFKTAIIQKFILVMLNGWTHNYNNISAEIIKQAGQLLRNYALLIRD